MDFSDLHKLNRERVERSRYFAPVVLPKDKITGIEKEDLAQIAKLLKPPPPEYSLRPGRSDRLSLKTPIYNSGNPYSCRRFWQKYEDLKKLSLKLSYNQREPADDEDEDESDDEADFGVPYSEEELAQFDDNAGVENLHSDPVEQLAVKERKIVVQPARDSYHLDKK